MNKINLYLAKNFLIRFTQVVGGFALLIFFINLIEMMKKMNESNAPLSIIATMSLMQVPSFLNDIVSSLVLISVIATFFTLSSRSEITIIRIGGFSLWSIIRPIALSAFCLGIFWVTIFDLLSIQMTKQYNRLEGKYINKESRNMVAPKNGIWLRQTNLENPKEELVIQAKK
ncbi:MAG: LptF/LptG family permease, partial [Alphaproteobacteria bacterium]|nr:LptF/LptG family permease [Alphaproteobacteria bacterium]